MCKPCKAELKKYQVGGFSKDGALSADDPIASGQFTMSQFLGELGNAGSSKGTQKSMDARGAAYASTLAKEQARVKKVIANIPGVTRKMEDISAGIGRNSSGEYPLADQQWGELDKVKYNDDLSNLQARREYTDSITKYGTISPDLDYLMPDTPDGTPFTMVDYDPGQDGAKDQASSGYDPTRSLSCIGSTCGAFQEAEKGTGSGYKKTKMNASNTKFRQRTLAGNTNFSEVPISDVQVGDIVQNRDWQDNNYNNSSAGQSYRPHHAGIVSNVSGSANTVSKDGSLNLNTTQPIVSAYNANNGNLGNYINQTNFGSLEDHDFDYSAGIPGRTEEQYAYRYTGGVPKHQRALNNFRGGTTNAFNYLQEVQGRNKYKADNSVDRVTMRPPQRIESGVNNNNLIPSPTPDIAKSRKRLFRR